MFHSGCESRQKLPHGQLPDPGLHSTCLHTDLSVDRDRLLEVRHCGLVLPDTVQHVRKVVMQRRLVMPVTLSAAERERLLPEL